MPPSLGKKSTRLSSVSTASTMMPCKSRRTRFLPPLHIARQAGLHLNAPLAILARIFSLRLQNRLSRISTCVANTSQWASQNSSPTLGMSHGFSSPYRAAVKPSPLTPACSAGQWKPQTNVPPAASLSKLQTGVVCLSAFSTSDAGGRSPAHASVPSTSSGCTLEHSASPIKNDTERDKWAIHAGPSARSLPFATSPSRVAGDFACPASCAQSI